MKLLTLNTHSLQEEAYLEKLEQFVLVIQKEKPDIIALQEVNQSIDAPLAKEELLQGWVPCLDGVRIRQDNHAAQVALRLNQAGICCSWTWISAKIGYDRYDEGMAFLCMNQNITKVDSFFLSKCKDYQNWKTRRALGIQIQNSKDWFYTVHMGWWQDEEEPFLTQWEQLTAVLQPKREQNTVWLMGDFNSPAEFRKQGYDCILKDRWKDTYQLAKQKDCGITVEGCIDGWEEFYQKQTMPKGLRMDLIWCSQSVPIEYSKVLFNGESEPKVSDHFGVLIKTTEIEKRTKRKENKNNETSSRDFTSNY